jgi:hypothetical protein
LLIHPAINRGDLGVYLAELREKRRGMPHLGDGIRQAIRLRSEVLTLASWCSADPLCIEADATGVDSLNLAACHACTLLPEVSCEEMNLFLDRGLLVGIPKNPELGFFFDLIRSEVD